jgi:hypothetical protein
MRAWKTEPVITDPPMEQWTRLDLPSTGEVQRLDAVNMANLDRLYCDYNPLTTLPWHDLQGVDYLGIYGCQFETLELWRLPNLRYCYAGYNYSMVSLDAQNATTLTNLDIYYCYSLVYLDVTGCTSLRYVFAYGCAFDEAMVDQLLTDLVANGVLNGYLRIDGGTNAPPSDPDGLALKAILIDRGWTVYTN